MKVRSLARGTAIGLEKGRPLCATYRIGGRMIVSLHAESEEGIIVRLQAQQPALGCVVETGWPFLYQDHTFASARLYHR